MRRPDWLTAQPTDVFRGCELYLRDMGSWDEVVGSAARLPVLKHGVGPAKRRESQNPPHSGTWTFGDGLEEYLRLARTGWDKGAKRVRKIASALRVRLTEPGTVASLEVYGAEVDIGLYLDGEPECMVDYVEDVVDRRVVRIAVGISEPSRVKAEEYTRKGAAIAAAIDAIEAAGVSVELDAVAPIWTDPSWRRGRNDPGRVAIYRARLKSAGQPLNVSRLAAAIAHPGAFRRLVFRVMEAEPAGELQRSFGDWYGYPFPRSCDIPREAKVEAFHRMVEWLNAEVIIGVGAPSLRDEPTVLSLYAGDLKSEAEAAKAAHDICRRIEKVTGANILA